MADQSRDIPLAEETLRCSLVIGITGHRKLAKEKYPAITCAVRDFYSVMQRENNKNITVLSPLAEGADMLCAQLAVDMGLRLITPLPLCAADYRKDFSGDTLLEFERLLITADEVFTVQPQEIADAHPARGFFYRQAGYYVAKHCDILLAVWNEAENDTPDGAGTWETIKLARKFETPVHIIRVR